MTTQCILFDLDNTLTDRKQSIANFTRRFQAHFAARLDDITFSQLEAIMQHGDNLGYRPKSQMFEMLARDLPWHEPIAADMIRDFWYTESSGCMQPRTGMIETLMALHHMNYRLGMITNGRTLVQNATIDTMGVRDLMEIIVISEAAGVRKPDAAIFQIALEGLAVKPEATWYVGDHPHSDMQGAANAGLSGVWMRSGSHPWPSDQASPDYEIESLPEILRLLAD